MARVLETDRLALRHMTLDDAPFILQLVNEPSFLRYIGDKGVRDLDDAKGYIETGPLRSYDEFGFGLLLVALQGDGTPIGMCGLLKRDTLPDVDIGFAYLPAYWAQGYAYEAATAVLRYGYEQLGIPRIVAVTAVDNVASIRLLEKLGLRFDSIVRLTPDGPDSRLFTP